MSQIKIYCLQKYSFTTGNFFKEKYCRHNKVQVKKNSILMVGVIFKQVYADLTATSVL